MLFSSNPCTRLRQRRVHVMVNAALISCTDTRLKASVGVIKKHVKMRVFFDGFQSQKHFNNSWIKKIRVIPIRSRVPKVPTRDISFRSWKHEMGFQKGKHHKTLCNNWYFLNTPRLDLDSICHQSWSHQSFENGTPKDGTFFTACFCWVLTNQQNYSNHTKIPCVFFLFSPGGPDVMSKFFQPKRLSRQDVQVLHVHRVHLWVVHRGDSGIRGWETQPKCL